MSFFGSFFGSDQRKDLKAGYADSKDMLQKGYDTGRGDIQDYYGKAQGYLDPYLQGGGKANAATVMAIEPALAISSQT